MDSMEELSMGRRSLNEDRDHNGNSDNDDDGDSIIVMRIIIVMMMMTIMTNDVSHRISYVTVPVNSINPGEA